MALSALAEIDAQYRQLREDCAVAARPQLKVIEAIGPEAGEYLQSQVTNDLDPVEPGGGVYAALLDRKARVQADMRVLRLDGETYWLLVEADGYEAALKHLQMYKIGRQVEVEPAEGQAVLSLFGPALEAKTGLRPGPALTHAESAFAGSSFLAVSTPLADLPGLDLVLPNAELPELIKAFADRGIPEVSEDALEILRIEAGLPRFGREITPAVMPAEAGIVGSAISFEKGCYIGQEPVARLHYKGRPNRLLRRLRLSQPVPEGAALRLGDRELGTLSSVCVSPALGALGLAVVRKEAEPGATIDVGDGQAEAVVEAIEVDA